MVFRGLQAQADANFVRAFCSSQGVELFVYDAVREGVQIPRTPVKNGRAGFGTGGSTGWRPRRRLPSLQHIRFRTRRKLCCSAWPAEQASTAWRDPAAPRLLCAPLPVLTRADTEAYCTALGQNYVQDETNAEDHYVRNRIRHEAIPALQYANPSAERPSPGCAARCASWTGGWRGRRPRCCNRRPWKAARSGGSAPGGGPVLDAALHTLESPVRDAEENTSRCFVFCCSAEKAHCS